MTLSAHDLACVRDDRDLFQNLSFELGPSESLLVEGRNGTGKTSLLRILCGIRNPDEGEVRWDGQAIEHLGAEYHQHLAYLGHLDGVKRELSPQENLRSARALGAGAELADEDALARVSLSGFEDVPVHKLSAGQRRRTALAQLLISGATLWVMDEPFTSLDRHGVDLVEELLTEHRARGGMVVVTSHHDMRLEGKGENHKIDLSARAS